MKEILSENKDWVEDVWKRCKDKVYKTSARIKDTIPYTTKNGKYDDKSGPDSIAWWTNSFYAGILWLLYNDTKDETFKNYAEGVEKRLDEALYGYEGLHHDVGFMWLLTSVANYTLTGSKKSYQRAMLAASTLASRYNVEGGYIRAWNGENNKGWAIIDCMMNIPILYWASKMTGDERFEYIARHHATKTMNCFIRPDGSVNHIVNFDPKTGEVVETIGGQGYGVGSSWSRGQSWAVNGFAQSYNATGDVAYLDAAKRVANYFISSVSDDFVPRVDFRQPAEPDLKDSSAGAIAACGLIEISKVVTEYEKPLYLNAAINILKALDEKCGAWDEDEEAILKYGTEAYHNKNGIHMALIYGDFYFMEAIDKLRNYDK